jgi:putative ABC transport system permease protein
MIRAFRSARTLPGAFARSLVRLRRFPPLLAAVVGAGMVVGIAAATGPMVVSSAGNAAIAERIGGPDAPPVGLRTQTQTPLSWDRVAFRLPLIRDAVRGLPVGKPVVTVLGSASATIATGGREAPVQMVTRSGFQDHVERVAGGGSAGLWVPSSVARTLKLRPGGTATLGLQGLSTKVRVAGVYRDIDPYHVPASWTPVITRIAPARKGFDPPPPFLLGDLRPFLDAERDVLDVGTVEIQVAVPPGLSLREARRVGKALDAVGDGLIDPMSPDYRAFDTADSLLPALVEQADQTVTSTTQPVQAISLAGELAALILAAAGGMFLARRRSVEFALLSARGTPSAALGTRTAVEALLPSVAGGVAGVALARALASATGPGGPVDAQAVRSAAVRGALGAVAAAIVVGVFTAVAVRMDAPDRQARGRAAARAPWELILLALAGASAYEIFTRGTGAVDTTQGQPPTLDLLVLAFPFLFVAGAAGLAVRLLRRALPRLRAMAQGRRPWVYLTAARVAGAPRLASVLVLVAGLAVGVLTYSNVLSASVAATADVKAILSVGTDVVATTGALPTIQGKAPFAWSPVERVPTVTVGDAGGPQVDVMAIDPRSFARAAAWVGPFGGPPDALEALDAGGPVPAITVGTALPADARLTLNGGSVAVRAVASLDAFPGVQPANPTLIVDLNRLTAVSPSLAGAEHSFELWARGDPAVILPVLRHEGFDPTFFVTARRERSAPGFQALSWTFGLLQTFGALAGLLSVLGAVLYLQARQQQREVTYALARRMGLRRKEHRRSIALELAGMLLAAFVIGAGFATAAAAIVHRKVDPLPALPPGPVFRVPVLALVAVAAAAAVLAWAGAMRVQRRADRVNVGELLRRAG